MNFRAVVFDLDGTLIDSKIDFESLRRNLSLDPDQDILLTIETWSSEKRDRAYRIVHEHERRGAEASTIIDGVQKFLARLRAHEIPCAIFTRNSNETARSSLELHQIPYDLLIAREDAPPKPAPDGLIRIMKEFGTSPSETLFVGDYIYDLEAGIRAGVQTALFLTASADFSTAGASFLFDDYVKLEAWLFDHD